MVKCDQGKIEIAGSIITLTADLVTLMSNIEEGAGIEHADYMELFEKAYNGRVMMKTGMSGRDVAEVLLGQKYTDEEYAEKCAEVETQMNAEHEATKN